MASKKHQKNWDKKKNKRVHDFDDFENGTQRKPKKRNKRKEKYIRSNNRIDRFGLEEDEDESDHSKARKNLRAMTTSKNELVRLNKYIAKSGICSRREADKLISQGKVKVNGKIETELGLKVNRKDSVEVNNQKIKPEKKVYILLNKPKGYVTTVKDPQGRRKVTDLIRGATDARVYPVGRLDRDTTGVLLLTNDGELTKRLTHPRYKKRKIYHVFLDKALRENHLEEIANGIQLQDGIIKADAIHYVDNTDRKQAGIEIHSGRNRIVRRIFEHFGYKVEKLDRVYFANLTKKGLNRGKWRFLNEKEIARLKMNAFS